MLLGIALHAALSFAEVPWVVQDSRQSGIFDLFFFVLHGFRMPLFFVLSGFFTAMLWRKRGLESLVFHRFKRIFLPLILSLITIIPATHIAGGIANSPYLLSKADSDSKEEQPAGKDSQVIDLWTAAATGNVEGIETGLNTTDVNQLDPTYGISPLGFAALTGQLESAESLIDHGANVSQPSRDQATPLHNAAFMGHVEVARLLIDNGANINAKTNIGATPVASVEADWGFTEMVAGIFKLPLDREKVTAGRKEIGILLAKAGAQGASHFQPDVEQEHGAEVSPEAKAKQEELRKREKTLSDLNGLKMLLIHAPILGHLWFLAFLCWLVVAFVLYALIANAIGFQKLPDWLLLSPLRYAWIIPLTLIPQTMMADAGFGPDTSIGLLPKLSCLTYYAVFFFVGAFYWDSSDHKGQVGRFWWLTLPLAILVVFPIGFDFSTGAFGFAQAWTDRQHHALLADLFQVTFAWLMTFGSMGMFRALLSKESYAIRYVSDSSYWLYLAHVPLVLVGQGIVRDWNMSPLLKFLIVCFSVSGILLLTYRYFVRYTFIGSLLNGKRERPTPIVEAEAIPTT